MYPVLNPHAMSSDEIAKVLATTEDAGLSRVEADLRLTLYGENLIGQEEHVSQWIHFVRQFRDPQMFLLFGAAALSLLVTMLHDSKAVPFEAMLILAIAILNAFLGFIQESRAEEAIAALRKMAPANARVIRDGRHEDIPVAQLVPGDVIILSEGAIVPADARLFASSSLKANEALLTGESEEVEKEASPLPPDTAVADRLNMVFAGTAITVGNGRAVVCSTGRATEVGKIAVLLEVSKQPPTRLQARLATISKRIAVAIGVIASLSAVTLLLLLRSRTLDAVAEVMLFGIALGVAAAPEALGTIITLALSVGVHRMAKQGAIVRRMNAIDTLGGVTVVMSDKTGTLTQNRMTVVAVEPLVLLDDGTQNDLLPHCSVLANAATVAHTGNEWSFSGDAIDVALWRHAIENKQANPQSIRVAYTPVREFAFSSERKAMSMLVADHSKAGALHLFTKGAPEVIFGLCEGSASPMTEAMKHRAAELAGRGLKVLAFAHRTFKPGEASFEEEAARAERQLSFLGLIALHDPPRPDVGRSIAQAAQAGIRTILISGDHPRTASAIASQLGITRGHEVLTGEEIDRLTDPQLEHRLERQGVLARVNPQHKLRAAQVLQKAGEVVAMTGDGVNDAPALQAADIGIAMGSGTEIAKEASDIILTDDNFSTIIKAIQEGRVLSANIRKAVTYLLSTNLCEVLTLFVAAAASIFMFRHGVSNLFLPLTTLQILWINLITDTAPALALALSPARDNVMSQPPSHTGDDILSRRRFFEIGLNSLIMAAATLSVYFGGAAGSIELRRTLTLTTLIMAQAFYAITLHSERASAITYISRLPGLVSAISVAAALHVGLLYSSFLSKTFGVRSLSLAQWGICLAAACPVLIVSEARKLVRRWMNGAQLTDALEEEPAHVTVH